MGVSQGRLASLPGKQGGEAYVAEAKPCELRLEISGRGFATSRNMQFGSLPLSKGENLT
jgi:hypothetical protein